MSKIIRLIHLVRFVRESNRCLSQAIILVVTAIALAGIGKCTLAHRAPKPIPPTQASTIVHGTVDWSGVNETLIAAIDSAASAARTNALHEIDALVSNMMIRADRSFLPWFFGYWVQQEIGLKSTYYWFLSKALPGQPAPEDRITGEIAQEFSTRVIRPETLQLELQRIARQSLQTFITSLGTNVANIQAQYNIQSADWQRYLDNLAAITIQTEANRRVPLTLKAIVTSSAACMVIVLQHMPPITEVVLGSMLARALRRTAMSKASGLIGLRFGGKYLPTIIAVAVIVWDIGDHYWTRHTNMPLLRASIAEYLDALKPLLVDEAMRPVRDLQVELASAIKARNPVEPGKGSAP